MRAFAKILAPVLLTALALFGAAGTASAASVDPVTGIGNPRCVGGLKIEPVTSGQYGPINLVVSGSSFSFTSSVLVTSVLVKGGPGFNLYTYPAPGVTSDTGLTAPINPNNNRPYGLSHLCFFTDGKTVPTK